MRDTSARSQAGQDENPKVMQRQEEKMLPKKKGDREESTDGIPTIQISSVLITDVTMETEGFALATDRSYKLHHGHGSDCYVILKRDCIIASIGSRSCRYLVLSILFFFFFLYKRQVLSCNATYTLFAVFGQFNLIQ